MFLEEAGIHDFGQEEINVISGPVSEHAIEFTVDQALLLPLGGFTSEKGRQLLLGDIIVLTGLLPISQFGEEPPHQLGAVNDLVHFDVVTIVAHLVATGPLEALAKVGQLHFTSANEGLLAEFYHRRYALLSFPFRLRRPIRVHKK